MDILTHFSLYQLKYVKKNQDKEDLNIINKLDLMALDQTSSPLTVEYTLLSSTHITLIETDHKQSPNRNLNKFQRTSLLTTIN